MKIKIRAHSHLQTHISPMHSRTNKHTHPNRHTHTNNIIFSCREIVSQKRSFIICKSDEINNETYILHFFFFSLILIYGIRRIVQYFIRREGKGIIHKTIYAFHVTNIYFIWTPNFRTCFRCRTRVFACVCV